MGSINNCNIKAVLEKEMGKYKSTFYETSFDSTNNEYLCNEQSTEVFNFDKYIEKKCMGSEKRPASPDAIYVGDNNVYFVEFKNSPLRNVEEIKIQDKFTDGTKALQKMLENTPREGMNFIFCVVYKNDDSSKKPFLEKYHQDIQDNTPKFSLKDKNKCLDNFYNKIITRDVDFYKKEFIQLKCETK